jgi:serine/threonine-protein kinase HipA
MDLGLAQSVAPYFRVSVEQAEEIISNQVQVVSQWRTIAGSLAIPAREQQQLEAAFRLAVCA